MKYLIEDNIVRLIIEQSEEIIKRVEGMFCLPKGYLRTQLALHFYQFNIEDIFPKQKINRSLIESECLRLGVQIKDKIQCLPEEYKKEVLREKINTKIYHKESKIFEITQKGEKNEIYFSEVDSDIGNLIQSKLHYLSNIRLDTLKHFGLFRKNEKFPFAYAAISQLDRNYILSSLPFETKKEEILVITRLYCINNSPYNSASLILSFIRSYIRNNFKDIRALVTSVNPNILFVGSSFKSSAFELFAIMPFLPFYYKGNYITRKTIKSQNLHKEDRRYLVKSKFKQLPVWLTINFLDKKLKRKIGKWQIKNISISEYNKG